LLWEIEDLPNPGNAEGFACIAVPTGMIARIVAAFVKRMLVKVCVWRRRDFEFPGQRHPNSQHRPPSRGKSEQAKLAIGQCLS
jgi:hypothetical protein